MWNSKRLAPLALAVCAHAATAADPVAAISVEKCEPRQVLMAISFDSIQKTTELQRRAADRWDKLKVIVTRHPEAGPNRPISEVLSKQETADFENLSAQIGVTNMAALAESRHGRDADYMMRMMDAADTLRTGGTIPSSDPVAAQPFATIWAVAKVLKDEHPQTKNHGECSLQLALEMETERRIDAAAGVLLGTPEFQRLQGLRTKYHLAEGQVFQPTAMAPNDAAQLAQIQSFAQQSTQRISMYRGAMDAIRFFADMSDLQVSGLQGEVLQVGGTRDYKEYDVLQRQRRGTLSPQMQGVWDAWIAVDSAVPSDEGKLLSTVGKIADAKQ
jgi:hypothetical protein